MYRLYAVPPFEINETGATVTLAIHSVYEEPPAVFPADATIGTAIWHQYPYWVPIEARLSHASQTLAPDRTDPSGCPQLLCLDLAKLDMPLLLPSVLTVMGVYSEQGLPVEYTHILGPEGNTLMADGPLRGLCTVLLTRLDQQRREQWVTNNPLVGLWLLNGYLPLDTTEGRVTPTVGLYQFAPDRTLPLFERLAGVQLLTTPAWAIDLPLLATHRRVVLSRPVPFVLISPSGQRYTLNYRTTPTTTVIDVTNLLAGTYRLLVPAEMANWQLANPVWSADSEEPFPYAVPELESIDRLTSPRQSVETGCWYKLSATGGSWELADPTDPLTQDAELFMAQGIDATAGMQADGVVQMPDPPAIGYLGYGGYTVPVPPVTPGEVRRVVGWARGATLFRYSGHVPGAIIPPPPAEEDESL